MKQISKLEVTRIKAGKAAQVGLLVELSAPKVTGSRLEARQPEAIVFVVDRSGSMGDGRLELVKNTIGEIIGRLAPTDYLGIISFDTEVEVHLPLKPVGSANAQSIRRDLANLESRGGTNIELGYLAGVMESNKAPENVKRRVILLSDGQANDGPTDPARFGQIAASATEHLVTTSTIGIGNGYDEQILVALADSGHGNHFAATELPDAIAGMQDEIDGLLERALSNVSCKIVSLSKEAKFKLTPLGFNRGVQTEGAETTVKFGDLASQEARGFAFLIDIASLTLGTEPLEFEITVEAFDYSSNQVAIETSRVTLEIADPVGFVVPVKNEDVVAEVLAYRVADLKTIAIRAATLNDMQLAKRTISSAKAQITDLLASAKDLSPRIKARLEAESEEMDILLEQSAPDFSKRTTESVFRNSRAKSDPRKKDR
jgi:Ca-activated chloride channel family protein